MATPSEQLSSRTKRVYSDSDTSSADTSLLNAKRQKRTQASLAQTTPAILPNENALPLRRRVNPDSLAIRLPANLVRELNAFILPGHTEMPTFAIRKELQERYDIDRRHIYDYFHSKGLRVVKEDRISNLVRGKRIQSSPRLQSPHLSEPAPLNEPERNISTPPVNAKLPTHRHGKTVKSRSQRSRGSSPSDPVATDSPPPKLYSFVNPLEHSIPLQLYENDPNYNSGALVDDRSCAVDDIDPYHSHLSERVLELHGSATPMVSYGSTTSSRTSSPQKSRPNTFQPLDQTPPSQSERILFYNILNDSLGPPHGLQECVGTYKAHMAERSRLYFERLFPSSRTGITRYNGIQPIRSIQPQSPTRPNPDPRVDFGVDFRKWLLVGKPFNDIQAVSNLETPRDINVSVPLTLIPQQDNITSVCDTLLFSPEIDVGGDTLDDLFPRPLPPLECIQDDMGSPVLRSEPLHPLSHFEEVQDFVLEERSITGTLPVTRSYPGSAVPISRLPIKNTYLLPRTTSTLQFSLSMYNDHLAAMPPSAAQVSADSDDIHDRRHGSNDLAVTYTGLDPRSRAVTFKRTNLETGRITSISGRVRTTSAGGGI